MGRFRTCEAIVLKAYDTADADKFCVLLTDAEGRVPVIAKGARKAGSRCGPALQSFQHLRVDLAEHQSGMYLKSAQCISPFPSIRRDVAAFLLASRGSELLLRFLHDTEPAPAIFALARDYFQCCDEAACGAIAPSLIPAFQLMLLRELGLLPEFRSGGSFPPPLRAFLLSEAPLPQRARATLSGQDQRALHVLCNNLLGDHLSFPLRSALIASGV